MIRVAKLTEAAFQRQVIQLAKLRCWRCAHFRPALTKDGRWRTAVQADGAGFPDLILLRGARCIAAELKVGKNKPTPEQHEWLAAFHLAAVENYIWRPENWDQIMEVLR